MQEAVNLGNSSIQYGFAGFCVLLLILVFWMITKLLEVIRENNKVIADHNQVMNAIVTTLSECKELAIDNKDKLLSRPCIARNK